MSAGTACAVSTLVIVALAVIGAMLLGDHYKA